MKLPRRKFLHLAAGAAALPVLSRSARAETYPTRPVHIVVGFPAATGPDIVARLIAEPLSERLGQQFAVEDRPGAGSSIAAQNVVSASADGLGQGDQICGHQAGVGRCTRTLTSHNSRYGKRVAQVADGSKNEPARAGARCARNGASGEARANRLIERC